MGTAALVDGYLQQARTILGTGQPAIAEPSISPGAPPTRPASWDGTAATAAQATTTYLDEARTTLVSRHTHANTAISNAATIATNAHSQLNAIETDWRTDKTNLGPFSDTPEGQAALNRAGMQRIAETQALVSETAAQYSDAANAIYGASDGLPKPDAHHSGDGVDETDDQATNQDDASRPDESATPGSADPAGPALMTPLSSVLTGSTAPVTSSSPSMSGMPMGAMPAASGSPMSGGGGLSSLLQPMASQAASMVSSHSPTTADNADRDLDTDSDASTGSKVVHTADHALGLPYIWGGGNTSGPTQGGFDCSGLTQWAVAQATNGEVLLPRTTYDQIHAGRTIDPDDARPGDLIFSNFSAPGVPEHVQIYAGDGRVIEAQQSGTPVKYSSAPSGAIVVKRVL